MMSSRAIRLLSSAGVGLVLLLALEVPALAYPHAPPTTLLPAAQAAPEIGSAWLDQGIPRVTSLDLRRAAAAEDEASSWEPTLPEGAVFTVLGAGFICGGAITLGVGLAQLIPIMTASGLIETAIAPLVLAGVGMTLLVVGIPFLIHGIVVLKAVRSAEATAAPTALWVDPRWAPLEGPRQSVLFRF